MEESNMKATYRIVASRGHTTWAVPLKSLCLCIALSGGAATAQAGQSKLIGVWKNDIQNVDCVSGQETGNHFIGLHTYYSDGNLLQISFNDPAVGNITQGRWSKAGKNKFSASTLGPLFDVNGFYVGYILLDRAITMAKNGQSLEFSAQGTRYTADGQAMGTACAVGTGVKLAEPPSS
jgi:hypothetical protein